MRNNLLRIVTPCAMHRRTAKIDSRCFVIRHGEADDDGCMACGTRKKNAAGWPREYSQTPSDEGNKQL
ncbi:hypothetical protein [Burkholderia territorii]|uniref:Uncharacterized protein n=1 Tax=Burkholderia territorii TaxID=1503055 RepID=A0A6L3NE31_9BURK|nr:hypothetical protein [Burkholderia territorii]KAB0668385.1 hypothetical protein F7R13_18150 [Burkholderia territorii]MBM2774150.1 hypothetical protein [Burkholderia territorii]